MLTSLIHPCRFAVDTTQGNRAAAAAADVDGRQSAWSHQLTLSDLKALSIDWSVRAVTLCILDHRSSEYMNEHSDHGFLGI